MKKGYRYITICVKIMNFSLCCHSGQLCYVQMCEVLEAQLW